MNNIRVKRQAKNLTQDALGQKVGVKKSTVSKWETGAATPKFQALLILAKELGCSIEELYENDCC